MLRFVSGLLWLSLLTDLCWALLFGPLHLRPDDLQALSRTQALPPGLRHLYLSGNSAPLALSGVEAVLKLVILALEPQLRAVLLAQPPGLFPALYAHWKPGVRGAAQWLALLARLAMAGAMLNSVVRSARRAAGAAPRGSAEL